MLKTNVGAADRVARAVLGAVAVGVAILAGLPSGLSWVVGGLGVVFLATAALSFCPLYLPGGWSTRSRS